MLRLLLTVPAVLLCAVGLFAPQAWAHGVSYTLTEPEQVISFEGRFSSGDPIAYGEVFVYSPQDAKIEYQNGRTDRRGRFSFVPDEPGKWHVVVNAGLGHRLAFDVDVAKSETQDQAATPEKTGVEKSGGSSPTTLAMILGISLILNIFLIPRLVLRKKKEK